MISPGTKTLTEIIREGGEVPFATKWLDPRAVSQLAVDTQEPSQDLRCFVDKLLDDMTRDMATRMGGAFTYTQPASKQVYGGNRCRGRCADCDSPTLHSVDHHYLCFTCEGRRADTAKEIKPPDQAATFSGLAPLIETEYIPPSRS